MMRYQADFVHDRNMWIPLLLGVALLHPVQTDWPQTRAERSNYDETSHYDDVIAFIKALQTKGAPIELKYIGTSAEGKPIPMVIASRPMFSSPADARRSGRPIIYIEANIHAGEVEGKEAALAKLREWSQEKNGVLDKAVVLCCPIYNIDGNEKFAAVERNRPEQVGPKLVGIRPNGQGFDLNRDCMKAESPEMQAVLANIYTTWDPDLVMDLHTTDGTRHGYDLTYAPPQNPNTESAVSKYSRDELIGDVRKTLRKQFNFETFDYGNTARRQGKQVFETFGEEGRYVTNYVGLRNRIGILSEAATFIPFKDRIVATKRFVQAVVDKVIHDTKKVVAMTRAADEKMKAWGEDPSKAPALGVRFTMDSRPAEDVLLEKPLPEGSPRPFGRPKELIKVKMPIFDRFKTTKTAPFPAAYVLPSTETDAVALLRKHGIVVERLLDGYTGPATEFLISEVNASSSAFQKHHLTRLEGKFQEGTMHIPPGDFLVRTGQPTGILIFNLMEPESLDGLAGWELLKNAPKVGEPFGILKLFKVPDVATEQVTP